MTASIARRRVPGTNRDYDLWFAVCHECGWRSDYFSNRTIQGRQVAQDRADSHRCKTSREEPAMKRSDLHACTDCGGPLVPAFATTANYERCRRCGHVFPA
jgi:membrane protease subunit (stomatin/prohibitin family)